MIWVKVYVCTGTQIIFLPFTAVWTNHRGFLLRHTFFVECRSMIVEAVRVGISHSYYQGGWQFRLVYESSLSTGMYKPPLLPTESAIFLLADHRVVCMIDGEDGSWGEGGHSLQCLLVVVRTINNLAWYWKTPPNIAEWLAKPVWLVGSVG